MTNSNMEGVGKVLERRLKSFGLEKQVRSARVCEVAKELSQGEYEPISFRNGILKIRVDSDMRAHLLKLRQVKILEKINHRLGANIVSKMRFVIT